MENFVFYNPTKIVFGEKTIAKLKELIPASSRVLILYGGASAEKTGTLNEVREALQGYQLYEFGGIEPNPEYETLMRAVEVARKEKIDFLLAVGGGSVLDGTKFIAAASRYDGDSWEIMKTQGRVIKDAIPMGTVLTLPATGSEMNNGAVITRKALKAKVAFFHPLVFPQFSILDPTKTYTLPQKQVANGVVDSFVHITEQYLTYPVGGMMQDKFAEGMLQILIDIGPQLLEKNDDYVLRSNFMWVATWALNGLIGAGVPHDWATHRIGHELTALYGMDHAQTLAVILPSLLEEMREKKREKLLQYAKNVWHITQGSDEEKITQVIAKTRAFFETMGVKTKLSDYGVKPEQVDEVIPQLKAHNMIALGEHGNITPEVSRKILENCF